MKIFERLLTKNAHKIPLLWFTFDLHKYESGDKKNCMVNYHPSFKDDEFIKNKCFDIIDYIRKNYDMSELL